ncbi:MAG: MGMT family protein [Patescibacteria group bacterium]|nr:MGMT family protein [Patescibacteria group bacterium]
MKNEKLCRQGRASPDFVENPRLRRDSTKSGQFKVKNFEKRVYEIVKQIPPGKLMTYKEITERARSPKAWRAVGNILAKNKNPKIPCHRVIRSDGKIGSYNKGKIAKINLLKKEGIIIKDGKTTARFSK